MNRNLRSLLFCRASFATLLIFFAASLAAAPAAHAGIVSSAGVTELAGPPLPSVHPGAQPALPTPIIFPEVLGGIVPAGGMPVDHDGTVGTAAPVESNSIVNPLLVSGVIPAGTYFDSYLFHFDPADSTITTAANFYPGSSILFSTKIIGVQLFTSGFATLQKPAATPYVGTLEAGDAVIAANGGPPPAYYPGGLVSRGMEEDAIQIASGGFQIILAGQASGVEIDQVRILVAAVPEPNSILLATAGLLGLALMAISRVGVVRRS